MLVDYAGKNTYGAGADWADSYFSRDADTVDIITGLTSGPLDYANNVDVTFLDPNKVSRGTFRSSWDGAIEQCYRTATSHEWVHQFYLKTILEQWPDANGFGFPLSKETQGENWNSVVSQYKVGNNPPLSLGTPDPLCIPDITPPPPDWKPFLDLFKPLIIKSTAGTSEVNGKGVKLITGSPVWIAVAVETTNDVNLLSLEAGFSSNLGAEGLLSVYWDTNMLGSIDERVVSPGIRQYTFPLSRADTVGTHSLGLRLDPFSSTASSVVVTNMMFGFVGVKEPFSLSVIGDRTNEFPILELKGQAGFSYRVESSTNLTDWSTLTILANTNGVVHFFDSSSTNANRRFYRVVAP